MKVPDVETWTKRYQRVSDHQKKWRTEAKTFNDLYNLTWILEGVPDNVPITVPSTAAAIIDEATDHTDFEPEWISVKTPSFGMKEDAEMKAGRIRSHLIGWLSSQCTYYNDTAPTRDWNKDIYLYGKAVYKIVADHEGWPQLDLPEDATNQEVADAEDEVNEMRKYADPALLRTVNPLAIYEDPTLGPKKWCIEEYEYEVQQVIDLYEDWLPSDTMDRDAYVAENADNTVRIWDCYQLGSQDGVDGIWHQVIINADDTTTPATAPVFFPEEPFPYVIRFSGFGRQSTGKYEEKARGILFSVVSLLKAEARRLTQLDAIIQMMAWPTAVVTGPRNRFAMEFGPNRVNYVPPGVTVNMLVPQIPAGPIQAALATIQAGIERGTFGSVIRGDKPAGTTSAAQLAIMTGEARLRFGSVKMHHQSALSEVFCKELTIVKNVLKTEVPVQQTDDTDEEDPKKLVLKPEWIPDNPVIKVEISSDPVEERDRATQLAIAQMQAGIIDEEEARERAGIKDTMAMRRRRIRDKVLEGSPNIIAALGEQYILASGYDIETLMLEKMMRDMHLARSQQDLMSQLSGGGGGGANPSGSQPTPQGNAVPGVTPTPLGGSPGGVPTAATAQQSAQPGTNVTQMLQQLMLRKQARQSVPAVVT